MAVNYEGQAAVELEAQAANLKRERSSYPLPVTNNLVLDARETVKAVLSDLDAGVTVPRIAAAFHNAVADATVTACTEAAARHASEAVVLSGGVFQNRLLLELTADQLTRRGLHVLVPTRLPPNDGGIAYGQAAVATASLSDRR